MSTDLDDLYRELHRLAERTGGPRELRSCTGRTGWPTRGVYFFFEAGEVRADGTPRVVRVGTHGLRDGSRSTLWGRLSQHRGNSGGRIPGGGNHRGSVFRLHVGEALLARDGDPDLIGPTWGRGARVDANVRALEAAHERRVSAYIGQMPFLYVAIDDAPGALSDRGLIERGAIGILSTDGEDTSSENWLGRWANRPIIRTSGLWNVNHIGQRPDDRFLDRLAYWVERT